MGDRIYKDAASLEKAVKAAALKSGQDTGKAIEAYYPGRLMERVFSEEEPAFVLKGGRSVLARTVNARYTRDTDFLYKGASLEDALEELKHLASKDLNDFIEFRFVSAERIAGDQEYRDGYRVTFVPMLGGTKKKSAVSVDLVVDGAVTGDADVIVPANRLDIDGLPVFDYHVYPVVNAIADKVCATLQLYSGGRPSSRVRDLVDLVVYITSESMDGHALSIQIASEARMRHLDPLGSFSVPDSWHTVHSRAFEKAAREAKLDSEYRVLESAEALVKRCVDPVIAGEAAGLSWSPNELEWHAVPMSRK